jgi:hypothetical protein
MTRENNLNKVLMTVASLAIAGLFAWGESINAKLNQQEVKNEIFRGRLVKAEDDIKELQRRDELIIEDIKIRVIKIEDKLNFK